MLNKVLPTLMLIFCSVVHAQENTTYQVSFQGYQGEVPVVKPYETSPVKIVYIDFLAEQNRNLAKAAIKAIANQIPKETEVLVIPGDMANVLGDMLAERLSLPRLILRSKSSPYGAFATAHYASITGGKKVMIINNEQTSLIADKKVVIFDCVISSGGTIKAAHELVEKAGGSVLAYACAFTEGDEKKVINDIKVLSLAHLPVFPVKGSSE
jgi:adenine phosphoribosyltransferase